MPQFSIRTKAFDFIAACWFLYFPTCNMTGVCLWYESNILLLIVWTISIQHVQKSVDFMLIKPRKIQKQCKTKKVPIFQKIQVKFWCSQLILSLTCVKKNEFPGLYSFNYLYLVTKQWRKKVIWTILFQHKISFQFQKPWNSLMQPLIPTPVLIKYELWEFKTNICMSDKTVELYFLLETKRR